MEVQNQTIDDQIRPQLKQMNCFCMVNQVKFVRLEKYLQERINKMYSYYQHYEILTLATVIITHHVDRQCLYAIYPFFIINIMVNAIYFNIISTYYDNLLYNIIFFILKIAYPLPFMEDVDISQYNSLYFLVYCFYIHRFYYVIQLISIYNFQRLRRAKNIVFIKKFEASLLNKKNDKNQRQSETIWKQLYNKNRKAALQLSNRIIQQTFDDLFLQIKYLFHFKPFLITLFLIVITTMILSYLFQQSEDSYYSSNPTQAENLDVREYQNSLYFVSITFRTIGYGDISPKTLIGKIIACITSLWGIIFTSLSLYIFNQHFALTEKEKKELNIDNIPESEQNSEERQKQQTINQYQEIIVNLGRIRNKFNLKSQLQYNQFVIDQIQKNNIIKRIQILQKFNY
ncbi:potassium cation channel protein (macronuclear) [Tetrahymena thermophila SB210]|uniref:Potassium cation channel protein n=1 Tax=Tetrahymena thermophila (strain SB210) TaxID=312017 RepID=Q235V1_TETTS|nr:potassium cation channel protein [Tetrahymena thermophila SB210]EAR92310.2 potassium cation channel protein [Tetrahymena thermophila SB210]|eukprot:XP_001012555.2 potassium cation channel protein [Tetrahymena thermophila SB210]